MAQEQDVQGPAPPEPMGPALAEFSAALAKRFPNLEIKRFVMPSAVRDVREIFIRELRTRDVIEADMMADATMTAAERASNKLAEAAQERESHRLSIVGVGDAYDGEIVYRPCNLNGIPFSEMGEWSKKATDVTRVYFNQVNGLPWEEVGAGVLGARIVGAFAPPTSGIPASASHGGPAK